MTHYVISVGHQTQVIKYLSLFYAIFKNIILNCGDFLFFVTVSLNTSLIYTLMVPQRTRGCLWLIFTKTKLSDEIQMLFQRDKKKVS